MIFFLQVLEPVSIDYDKVMGDMTGSADEEGGDQKAVQLATAASSVLNAKAGKSSGNDSSAASERAAVSKKIYSNNKNKTSFVCTHNLAFFNNMCRKKAPEKSTSYLE